MDEDDFYLCTECATTWKPLSAPAVCPECGEEGADGFHRLAIKFFNEEFSEWAPWTGAEPVTKTLGNLLRECAKMKPKATVKP